jgi:hypothetical protein
LILCVSFLLRLWFRLQQGTATNKACKSNQKSARSA